MYIYKYLFGDTCKCKTGSIKNSLQMILHLHMKDRPVGFAVVAAVHALWA